MQKILEPVLHLFSSLKLSVVLLILLAILTWLGTLEQVNSGLFEVQHKYFDSFFLVHRFGDVPVPLPGARLVMAVLFVNIGIGGVVRLRRGASTAGILITHLGIMFLLVAGMIKAAYAVEGHVTLFEGGRADTFESYYDWEIALLEDLGNGRVREIVAPQLQFERATAEAPARLTSSALPFDLEVQRYLPNCRALPKGPMFTAPLPVIDGFFLQSQPLEKEAEGNIAGAYIALIDKHGSARQEALLWGAENHPLTADLGGKKWAVELRHERHPMPFTIGLEKFTKEDHPRMDMAKAFSSDVTVGEGNSARPVKISMNEPLRQKGLVVYQASWGPSNARPGQALFSTLAVVQNPADQYPLYACIIIAIGLTLHFSRKLARHIRSEAHSS